MKPAGYASRAYAESLAEFGTPRILPRSEGWILERPTPGLRYRDAMGCYPLFRCRDWSRLALDLDDVGDSLASITLVPDPFGDFDEARLHECFPDLVVPFKRHYVADLRHPVDEIVSRHHRKYARRAQRQVRTEVCREPDKFFGQWMQLHRNLVHRHGISGIRAYSGQAFKKQLGIPGMVVLKALHGEQTVGAQLWFMHDDVAFGHVQAFTAAGYDLGASYALYWFALNYFVDKVRWCDFGGVAGMQDDENSQLNRFKQGWSTGRRTAYLCGRITNRKQYDELVAANRGDDDFFPAYRAQF